MFDTVNYSCVVEVWMTAVRVYNTVIGPISLTESDGFLVGLSFSRLPDEGPETTLLRDGERELHQWLAGDIDRFTIPWKEEGTVFMRSVWSEILKIGRGRVTTYGDIAKKIGKPTAARAVGGACHRNPLPLVIPCHRVLGASYSLTGFAAPIELKETLLRREGVLL